MPKPKKGPRLGSNPAHQKLLLATMAAQLFVHEGIETTEAKAKALRPFAEKLITFAKRGDLGHAARSSATSPTATWWRSCSTRSGHASRSDRADTSGS